MIVLVGFMGAGKSVVGRKLAARMNLPFVDLDEEIVQTSGTSIREIFETRGEGAFREMERAALRRALSGSDRVIAAGGGVVEDESNRAALTGATVVFLDADLDEALRRIDGDRGRPMLTSADPAELYGRRRPMYQEVADVVVDAHGRTVGEIVEEIALSVRAERSS